MEVVGKGVIPYPLPIRKMGQCVLVPSINQSLAMKGLAIDRIAVYRQECNGPAARLNFQPPHRACKHSFALFQRSAGTRLGYAVMQPVLQPLLPSQVQEWQLEPEQTTNEQEPPVWHGESRS